MKLARITLLLITISIIGLYCSSDSVPDQKKHRTLTTEFKNYWYKGEAELTSYDIVQARYGELHAGSSVLIFVTEPFNPFDHVKEDNPGPGSVSVLKLNNTRTFNTGIYPYSMMTSIFQPLETQGHAMKISSSSQEWCGHTFMQLNNKDKFKINKYSYFQSESDTTLVLDTCWLEDELWTKLRISPQELPIGKIQIIPSFFDLRLRHREAGSFLANATNNIKNGVGIYQLTYIDIQRTLTIYYEPKFPYVINGWEEKTESGFGKDAKILTTKATKKSLLKIDYWNKNSVKDFIYRDSLGL